MPTNLHTAGTELARIQAGSDIKINDNPHFFIGYMAAENAELRQRLAAADARLADMRTEVEQSAKSISICREYLLAGRNAVANEQFNGALEALLCIENRLKEAIRTLEALCS